LLIECDDRGGTNVCHFASATWREPAFDFRDFEGPPATDDEFGIRNILLNRECLEALQEIPSQFFATAHTSPVAMHHDNIIRHQGGEPLDVTGLDSFEPSLANSRDGRNYRIVFLPWEDTHDCPLRFLSYRRGMTGRGNSG
jgi:hypothetical protein